MWAGKQRDGFSDVEMGLTDSQRLRDLLLRKTYDDDRGLFNLSSDFNI